MVLAFCGKPQSFVWTAVTTSYPPPFNLFSFKDLLSLPWAPILPLAPVWLFVCLPDMPSPFSALQSCRDLSLCFPRLVLPNPALCLLSPSGSHSFSLTLAFTPVFSQYIYIDTPCAVHQMSLLFSFNPISSTVLAIA